jgi:hypothetical protein
MKRISFAVLALAAGATHAEQHPPSPLDAKAKAPAVRYRSAFEGYRPYAEQERADWRKANDAVARPPAKGAMK